VFRDLFVFPALYVGPDHGAARDEAALSWLVR